MAENRALRWLPVKAERRKTGLAALRRPPGRSRQKAAPGGAASPLWKLGWLGCADLDRAKIHAPSNRPWCLCQFPGAGRQPGASAAPPQLTSSAASTRPRAGLAASDSCAKNRAGENRPGRPDQAGQVGSHFPADRARRRGQPERRRKTRPAKSRSAGLAAGIGRGPGPWQSPQRVPLCGGREASWWRTARSAG